MKKPLFILIAFIILLSSLSQAAEFKHRSFGVGIVLGAPSGLVGKHWVDSDKAWDFGIAVHFSDVAIIYSDYLFHFPRAFGSNSKLTSDLSPYIGVGGEIIIWTSSTYARRYYDSLNGFGLAVRIPLGIEWKPVDPPIGVFFELVPGLGIIPGTFGFVQAGLGIRFYF